MNCPLCHHTDHSNFHVGKKRRYLRCVRCSLVFVPPDERLDPIDERARYEKHQNSPEDAGYVNFLSPFVTSLGQRLPQGAKGLDYGAGPGPTVSVMLEKMGFSVSLYDIFFHPDTSLFDEQFQFVTCTEVIEHCFSPMADIQRMWSILEPGGVLGVMTEMVIDKEQYANWHYIRDDTHVCFFSKESFHWIGEKLGSDPIFEAPNTVFYKLSHRTQSALLCANNHH